MHYFFSLHDRYLFFTSGVYYLAALDPSDVIYDPLPLYHTAGGMLGTGQALLYACSTVIRVKFSASKYWEETIRYSVTVGIERVTLERN